MLLRSTWIKALERNIPALQPVEPLHVNDVEDPLRDYPSLFLSGLGTFEGTTAKIYVPANAQPKFFKLRPLPIAFRDGVT